MNYEINWELVYTFSIITFVCCCWMYSTSSIRKLYLGTNKMYYISIELATLTIIISSVFIVVKFLLGDSFIEVFLFTLIYGYIGYNIYEDICKKIYIKREE